MGSYDMFVASEDIQNQKQVSRSVELQKLIQIEIDKSTLESPTY